MIGIYMFAVKLGGRRRWREKEEEEEGKEMVAREDRGENRG